MASRNPLKSVCIIGLVLALLVSWAIVLFAVIWERDIPKPRNPAFSFALELAEYDLFDAPKRALDGENPDQTERRLAALQKKVRSVEEQLSVLKRRRTLAAIDRRFIAAYRKAALEAAETLRSFTPRHEIS